MRQPVFIYGAMRSGTTVFRLMLDRHHAMSNPGEVDFLFDHLAPSAGGWTYDFAAMRGDRIYESKRLIEKPGLDGEAQLRDFVDQFARRAQGRLLTLNIHRNAAKAARLFPGARFVHLLRDPRDVARSSVQKGWAEDLWSAVDHWIETERDWDRAAASLPPGAACELRYERLFRDIDGELRRICAFLDIPYSAEMLRYHETSNYGPPDPRLIEQWRRDPDPREIGELEARIGDLLAARDYAPSGFAAVAPEAPTLFWRRVRRKLLRRRKRVAQVGLSVVLAEKLTRWLGMRESNLRLRRRINANVSARLK